jgi:hypothetical protein
MCPPRLERFPPLKVQETSNNHRDLIKRRGPHVLPHQVLRARTYLQVKGTAGNDGRSLGRLDQLRDSGQQVPSWSRGSSVVILSAHPGPPARHPHIADRTRRSSAALATGPVASEPARATTWPRTGRIRQVWAIFLTVLLSPTGSGRAWGQGSS